jgi:hypothetical protein
MFGDGPKNAAAPNQQKFFAFFFKKEDLSAAHLRPPISRPGQVPN